MEETNNLLIRRTNSDDMDFKKLTSWLDEELWERYGQIQAQYLESIKLGYLDTVLVGYENEEAVACGCFQRYNHDVAEIKRMFVLKSQRRKGYSKHILNELEKWATEDGFPKVVLETGRRQPEAIQLYQSNGYTLIDNFGKYQGLSNSVCFEKDLKQNN